MVVVGTNEGQSSTSSGTGTVTHAAAAAAAAADHTGAFPPNYSNHHHGQIKYYAIRRSKYVTNGIFLSWEDVKHHLNLSSSEDNDMNGDGHDTSDSKCHDQSKIEYSTFNTIEDTLQYLMGGGCGRGRGHGHGENSENFSDNISNNNTKGNGNGDGNGNSKYGGRENENSARDASGSATTNDINNINNNCVTSTTDEAMMMFDDTGTSSTTTAAATAATAAAAAAITPLQLHLPQCQTTCDNRIINTTAAATAVAQNSIAGTKEQRNHEKSPTNIHTNKDKQPRAPQLLQIPPNKDTEPIYAGQGQRSTSTPNPSRVVNKRRPSKNWMAMYERLKEYRNKNGSFHINSHDKANVALKRWVGDQKHQYKNYKLGKNNFSSDMKRKLLSDIGFDFEYYSFDERLRQLRVYKEQHGTTDVPIDHPLLGKWMEKQRRQITSYKKGKESKLDDVMIRQLMDVGVDIESINTKPNIIPRQETPETLRKWEEMFDQLKQYKRTNKNCNVPKSSDAGYVPLYKWVLQQRLEYKKLRNNKLNKMTASRLQKLNDLGFVFTPRTSYLSWDERMGQLREYKERNGHLRVPATDPDLGEFVARQRLEYSKFIDNKTTNMNERRVQDLIALGFIFQVGKRRSTETTVVRKSWDERFAELLQFKDTYGHTLVPQNSSALGEWVHKQRKMYKLLKSGKPCSLTTERALKLADVGFVFDASAYRRGRKMVEEPMTIVPTPVAQSPIVPDPYEEINHMSTI